MRDTKLAFVPSFGDSAAFAQPNRAKRRHPRRDPEGHTKEGAAGGKEGAPKGETDEQKSAREANEKKAADEEVAKDAKSALTAAEKRAKAAEDALEAEKMKTATDDEKKTAETVKAKVTEAVSAKEVELTDHYEGIISSLRNDIIESTIQAELSAAGRNADDFKTVISTLDKSGFLDNDGAVKKADVKKWASELAGSASSRPPRTGTSRGSSDRGFGKYLQKD